MPNVRRSPRAWPRRAGRRPRRVRVVDRRRRDRPRRARQVARARVARRATLARAVASAVVTSPIARECRASPGRRTRRVGARAPFPQHVARRRRAAASAARGASAALLLVSQTLDAASIDGTRRRRSAIAAAQGGGGAPRSLAWMHATSHDPALCTRGRSSRLVASCKRFAVGRRERPLPRAALSRPGRGAHLEKIRVRCAGLRSRAARARRPPRRDGGAVGAVAGVAATASSARAGGGAPCDRWPRGGERATRGAPSIACRRSWRASSTPKRPRSHCASVPLPRGASASACARAPRALAHACAAPLAGPRLRGARHEPRRPRPLAADQRVLKLQPASSRAHRSPRQRRQARPPRTGSTAASAVRRTSRARRRAAEGDVARVFSRRDARGRRPRAARGAWPRRACRVRRRSPRTSGARCARSTTSTALQAARRTLRCPPRRLLGRARRRRTVDFSCPSGVRPR